MAEDLNMYWKQMEIRSSDADDDDNNRDSDELSKNTSSKMKRPKRAIISKKEKIMQKKTQSKNNVKNSEYVKASINSTQSSLIKTSAKSTSKSKITHLKKKKRKRRPFYKRKREVTAEPDPQPVKKVKKRLFNENQKKCTVTRTKTTRAVERPNKKLKNAVEEDAPSEDVDVLYRRMIEKDLKHELQTHKLLGFNFRLRSVVEAEQNVKIRAPNDRLAPVTRKGDVNWFWNDLNEDDELLKESKKRPYGMNFMCNVCYSWYKTYKEVVRHMFREHISKPIKSYNCSICNKVFLAKFLLNRHEANHEFDTNRENFAFFDRKGQVLDTVEENKEYLGIKTGFLTPAAESRINEIVEKYSLDSSKCFECGEEVDGSDLENHYLDAHSILKPCKLCGEDLEGYEELSTHLIQEHSLTFISFYEWNYSQVWELIENKEIYEGIESSHFNFIHSYAKRAEEINEDVKDSEKNLEENNEIDKEGADSSDLSVDTAADNVIVSTCPYAEVKEEYQEDGFEIIFLNAEPSISSSIKTNNEVDEELKDAELHESDFKMVIKPEFDLDILKNKLKRRIYDSVRIGSTLDVVECKMCETIFDCPKILAQHREEHHIDFIHNINKYTTCSICNKYFKKTNIQNHELSHTDPHYYLKCQGCWKKFKDLDMFFFHQKTHDKMEYSKRYTCFACNRAYNHISLLKRHARTHTGEYPYPCDYCGQRFSDLMQLKYHHLKDHDDYRHICQICGKEFILLHDLKKHHSHVHNMSKESSSYLDDDDDTLVVPPPTAPRLKRKYQLKKHLSADKMQVEAQLV